MRKTIYQMHQNAAWETLTSARTVHLSTVTAAGEPVFRTVNAIVADGALVFHGAPVGEKTLAIGQRAVAATEEVIATVPSYFLDPERACPATTYYRSVQAHGHLVRVEDVHEKARLMQLLMAKYQPEGGHVPMAADHPLYQKALAGLMVVKMPVEHLDGKAKLGQNRNPAERQLLLSRLWERGESGDSLVIELILDANPGTPLPEFLAGPTGVRLVCQMSEADLAPIVDLLSETYWNQTMSPQEIAAAQVNSIAWVGARDDEGRPIASARAISDGAKYAWIYDVVVAPQWRGRGVGTAVVRLLLDHPRVRGARCAYLSTKDAQPVYERIGFVDRESLPPKPWPSTEMVLVRRPNVGGDSTTRLAVTCAHPSAPITDATHSGIHGWSRP